MNKTFNTVSVVGLGYIGLPTAAILASRGVKVIGVDINRNAVDTINQGRIHIVEPGLDVVVQSVVQTGQLRATTTPEAADAFILAVPTPFKDHHEPDVSYVEAATRSIAPVLRKGNLVILESTSPVGTTEDICRILAQARPDLKFPTADGGDCDVHVAYCPERVLPGHVLRELIENDRVLGGITPECATHAATLYKIFVQGECVITNARTAEMTKLTENSFRDVNIAFANELSIICDKLGINVWELISLANRHPRVNILQPGPGVGGHCISVDPWFIVHKSPEESRLIRTAREVNDSKPKFVLEKIRAAVRAAGTQNVSCFGLAFKADIDDLRESPAVEIVHELAKDASLSVKVVEPYVDALPAALAEHTNIELVKVEEALKNDVCVLLVNHTQFADNRAILASANTKTKPKTWIDTRGLVALRTIDK